MKKITLSLIALSFLMHAQAQIKLTYKTHALKLGDKHDFIIAKNIDEGMAGANANWDFSGLEPADKNLTSNMLEPSVTEKGAQIDNANLALKEFDNLFYFKVTPSGIEQYGSYSCNSLTTYSKPFIKMKYPFGYAEVVKGDYAASQLTGTTKTEITGQYILEGDAYGSLILPNGIYNSTLRVKQTRTYNYANGGSTTEITYRWYAPNVRYPVLVIIKYENNGVSTISQVAYFAHYSNSNDNLKSATSVDNAISGDGTFEVSPNPFYQVLNINYNIAKAGKISIELYDASGKIVTALLSPSYKNEGTYNEQFNVPSNLAAGVYYLKVIIGENISVKKIIKL